MNVDFYRRCLRILILKRFIIIAKIAKIAIIGIKKFITIIFFNLLNMKTL